MGKLKYKLIIITIIGTTRNVFILLKKSECKTCWDVLMLKKIFFSHSCYNFDLAVIKT